VGARPRISTAIAAVAVLLGAPVLAEVASISGAASVAERAVRIEPGGAPTGAADPLPAEAQPVDTSDPDHVVGNGTPASCTSAAVVAAVAAGGVITFDCGPDPVTITMLATAKVVNTSPEVVIDGGGLVTLSGAGQRRNGTALSSIGVSWRVYRSEFTGNRAIGVGANPARPGTPGGGNGGAIALDGNRFTLDLIGSTMRDNVANEGGGAIFFVSNDRTGELRIDGSTLDGNPSLGFETRGYPGIFFLGAGAPQVTDSTIR